MPQPFFAPIPGKADNHRGTCRFGGDGEAEAGARQEEDSGDGIVSHQRRENPCRKDHVRLSDRLVRTAGAGERADGRVEVKGEFSDEERPQILDRHRTQPVIRINRASVPVNDGGRFSHMIEERCDHIEIELRDAQGRAVQTLLPLPKINLHVPCQGMYVPFHLSKTGEDSPADRQGKGQEAEARLDVNGETEKGNTLKMNGQRCEHHRGRRVRPWSAPEGR
ncbi:MAG: hypothetical protein MZV70_65910 [Desulfobacterales bacterium]|nr:hypothetical protein [Desulfobacterales bacterium]